MLGGLAGGGGGGLELKKKGELRVSSPDFLRGGSLTGGRSRASIQRVIMQNMAALRYAYNRRLREKTGLCGKITVKFAIDEFGKAVLAQVVESTMNDSSLEHTVISRIKSWSFERLDKPGDVTEVTYPFVFSDASPCAETTNGSAQTGGNSESPDQLLDRIDRQAKARADREKAEREARERRERESAREEARMRAERQAGDTLNGAVAAANTIKHWWNTDFAPSSSKYPIPDETGVRFSAKGTAKSDFVRSTDYLREMTGKTADDYKTYLNVRKDYANSPTFYFNMASWFYACGDRETAVRVLTSIADLELENAALYRLLGYRLKEFGEYALEKFVCRKVVQWRPMEPQSHRDYALALADNGEAQAALSALYGVLTKTYSANIANRSRGIAEVTVTEINRLIAKYPNLNTSKIYKRLLIDIPVDVRVVINWNMNSTDIDLHVVDPTGEECYYSHSATKIGGRISADVTNGYGPEQFLLKNAVKGKYRVYVNYYGDRQVTDAGPSTVMAEIYTKYADKTERRKVVCLQMSNAMRRRDGNVPVAEFEF
ncbi:MAG: AgmX/PglI C-terminal domain-containing protein [Chitinispirillales bacterium]|nr:AgmX/PglI C-terminal domain-containing protein [Chitinispirillales bacterium]